MSITTTTAFPSRLEGIDSVVSAPMVGGGVTIHGLSATKMAVEFGSHFAWAVDGRGCAVDHRGDVIGDDLEVVAEALVALGYVAGRKPGPGRPKYTAIMWNAFDVHDPATVTDAVRAKASSLA